MYLKMRIYPFTEDFYHKAIVKESYESRLLRLRNALDRADFVVIGAGAGLSAAAGITYSGKRFTDNFTDFIAKYGLTDMYSSAFYPFKTEEERWAYWARHILMNRLDMPATDLYRLLLNVVKEKDYFVITTNVDGQFEKSGFDRERIFTVQGDYAYLQCANGCHDKLYYNENLVREMARQTTDCRIPSGLVPHCPVCGGKMDVHVRKDRYFVQDSEWYASNERYQDFMGKACDGNALLLELGVDYNTPTIIRFPFERLAALRKNITLVRINRDYPDAQVSKSHFISFDESCRKILQDLDYTEQTHGYK